MAVDPDQIFQGLPSEPFLAAYELLTRIERALLTGKPTDAAYAEACGLLEAFYDEMGWKAPPALTTPGYSDSVEDVAKRSRAMQRLQYEAYLSQIMHGYRAVVKERAKTAIASQLANEPGYAILEGEEKKKLHEHLEKIRSIVEASPLDDRKKNSLFAYINDLSREIDRNGTRTDRFFAFAGELGFYIGQFAKSAKPAVDEAKAILKIIWQARERHDGTKLPRPDDVLLLPEPEDSAS
jgi:hypothetical protein